MRHRSPTRNEHWKAFRTFSDYFYSNPSSVRGWNIGKIPSNILLKSSLEEKPSPTWTMGRLIDLHGFVPAADQTCSPRRWIHLAKKTTRRHCCEIHPSCAGSGQKPLVDWNFQSPVQTLSVVFTRFAAAVPPLWRSQSKPFPPLPTSEASNDGNCTMQRIQWSNLCKTKLKILF